jgi:beta-lactamase class D
MYIISRVLPVVLALSMLSFAQQPFAFPLGMSGEFVSLDLKSGRYFRVNPEGCKARFAPYSTFKIPNSLIGLETGVISDPDTKWHWDAEKYPVPRPGPSGEYAKTWQQDLSMRTALENSIVWYYREVATKIGEQRMQQWLKVLDYGNQDISGGLDRFWLDSSLRISPEEQVRFVTKLQRGEVPIAKKHLDVVKDVLTLEKTSEYRWIGKTGSSAFGEGWLVGWVESAGSACSYALHMNADSYGDMAKARLRIAKELLRNAGCLAESTM